MRKIKLFPAPHVEVRIHVSDEMERDYRECKRRAQCAGFDGFKDCGTCNWRDVKLGGKRLCGLVQMKQLLEENHG